MQKVKVIFSSGQQVEVEPGTNLSGILRSNGVLIDFPCGGLGKCGQCKIKAAEYAGGVKQEIKEVLACSHRVWDDLWVDIPADGGNSGTVILTGGSGIATHIDSGVRKVFLPFKKADKAAGSYWEILYSDLSESISRDPDNLDSLQDLSRIISGNRMQGLTAVTVDNRLVGLEPEDTSGKSYGLAFDVGTTTVVGYLTDLNTGDELAVNAELNGQRIYGADVISRISAVQKEPGLLRELQNQVIKTLNSITEKVTREALVSPDNIYSVTIAGNTCMHHLLLGLHPAGLGKAPFLPVSRQELNIAAEDIGLVVNPRARLWIFPVIAGFVGGDTVAAMLSSDLHKKSGVRLLIDIGTNGELVINANGRLAACSAAAGPALEGAQITFGMRAETGAISRIRLVPAVALQTIGDGTVKGICGSGLVDLLGEMVKAGLVNTRGRIAKPEQFSGPEYLRRRLVRGEKGYRFIVVEAEKNNGREVFITQEDVTQLQLAKGALRSAMELLVKKVGMTGQDVDEILLPGAFGNFLDIDQARAIGLLPDWSLHRVTSIGNAAGEGAKVALLSREKRSEAIGLARAIEFLELAGTADFNREFTKSVLF